MKILPLASGSKGNCYLIDDGEAPLLLEAGLPAWQVKERLWKASYSLSSTKACLISHSHKDHSRAAKDILKYGVDLVLTRETMETIDLFSPHIIPIDPIYPPLHIGPWVIKAFATEHDTPGSVGYYLYNRTTQEIVLFATDTAYIRNRFQGLTHIMVECNYDPEILWEAFEVGKLDKPQGLRIMETHFGLENVLEFFKANDLSRLQEVWLLHLSERHIDPQKAKEQVQEVVGVPVYIASEEVPR